jgi:hypothetical protein
MKIANILYKSLNPSSFDLVFRYYPIVRHIRKSGIDNPKILEVGSGKTGITPFLKKPVFSVDLYFSSETNRLVKPIIASAMELPFQDGAFDFVICVDMLEHIPAEERKNAITEFFRLARGEVIVGVPCSQLSSRYEKSLNDIHMEYLHRENPFLREHMEFGLPDAYEMKALISNCASAAWPDYGIRILQNVNLHIWHLIGKYTVLLQSHFGESAIEKSFSPWFCWLFDKIIHWPPAYRQLFFASRSEDGVRGSSEKERATP